MTANKIWAKHQRLLGLLPSVAALIFIVTGTSVGLWQTYHPSTKPLIESVPSVNGDGQSLSSSGNQGGQQLEVNDETAPLSSKIGDFSISDLLLYTNQKRTAASIPSLVLSPKLNNSAQAKCNDMVAKNYWAHEDPEGVEPWHFFVEQGYVYKKIGENLASGQSNSLDVINGWMNSPNHRDNLLDSAFKDVGFGVCYSQYNSAIGLGFIVVQHLGTPQ